MKHEENEEKLDLYSVFIRNLGQATKKKEALLTKIELMYGSSTYFSKEKLLQSLKEIERDYKISKRNYDLNKHVIDEIELYFQSRAKKDDFLFSEEILDKCEEQIKRIKKLIVNY